MLREVEFCASQPLLTFVWINNYLNSFLFAAAAAGVFVDDIFLREGIVDNKLD